MSGNPEPSAAGAVATPDGPEEPPGPSGAGAPAPKRTTRRAALVAQVKRLVAAIREGDEQTVESAVLALSQSRRIFAPLAFVVGAFVMLFDGMKLLVTNWRLTAVQVLPAMWIWLAMLDVKAHVLYGKDFVGWKGPGILALVVLCTVVTAAAFHLNAVFGFAIGTPGAPAIRPAFARARQHNATILGWGLLVGLALGVSAFVTPRLGPHWFGISMSIVVGAMMFFYVAIPSRLLGIKAVDTNYSRRDKLAASAMGGLLGAIICTPPYAIGRVGIIMLGSKTLFVFGVILVALGFTLQAGATGSVKAIKMSAKLAVGRSLDPDEPAPSAAPGSPT
jgi:hypothetical protein